MERPPPEYLRDASHFKGEAEEIAFPDGEEEIVRLVERANEKKIPLTVAGAGTGLTGARVPQGGMVLSTERLNRILKVEWNDSAQEGCVTVQPAVTLKELEEALDPKGLFYPPDPGEKKATIGGTVATNASGARSFKYGPTRRHVKRLRIILPTGDLLDLRRGQAQAKGGTCRLTLPNGREIQIRIPTYSMPPVKNAAGYYARPEMDLLDLFIGSEGTLGIFTEIELAILKRPQALLAGILFFDSEEEAFRFSEAARQEPALHPRALEFFDSRSLKLLSRRYPDIPPKAAGAIFLAEEGAREASHWIRLMDRFQGLVPEPWISSDPKDHQLYRELRYSLPVLVNEQAKQNGFRKLGTDLAVPEASAKGMFDFYLKLLPASGIDFCLFGHIGDHHLHANLLPRTAEEFERSKGLYDQMARKALELGGTISAEHGIGKVRIPYLEWMVGRRGVKEMALVKRALDPNGILNRGNIIPLELL
ncbi:MAG: FAD-binding oxidoreductase [Candidatus Omnitrophica bacterium]|nr:FAD-binding oxidoreductase [Candidatus Omnitrophota bacterium]